jgi:hypothetical protein
MDGILVTLKNLSFAQIVLAWVFMASYALALGGMLGAKGSLRAAGAALVAAVLFSALSDDWVHGALLILFAVAGMGVFVATSWVLTYSCAWLISRGERQPAASPAPRATAAHRPTLVALRALWRSRVTP